MQKQGKSDDSGYSEIWNYPNKLFSNGKKKKDQPKNELGNSSNASISENQEKISSDKYEVLDQEKIENSKAKASSSSSYHSMTKWFHNEKNEESVSSKTMTTNEELKREGSFVKTIRKIRNKFLSRKLVGKINIHQVTGIISTNIELIITENDSITDDEGISSDDDDSNLSYNDKRAITTTDTVLDSLERRSLAWEGVEFNKNVLLSRGATFGFTDPFLRLVEFSISMDISATAKSLIASRRRYNSYQLEKKKKKDDSKIETDPPKKDDRCFEDRLSDMRIDSSLDEESLIE